jgi:hypothetical protein
MFYVVTYRKVREPKKSGKGDKNIDVNRSPGFKRLKDAEMCFYNLCTKANGGTGVYYRIDNSLVTTALRQIQFFNPVRKCFYIKTKELNEFGKYKFDIKSMVEYKQFMAEQLAASKYEENNDA